MESEVSLHGIYEHDKVWQTASCTASSRSHLNLSSSPSSPFSLSSSSFRSGHNCLAWSDLDLHWEFPEGDLERDGCRCRYLSSSSPIGLMLIFRSMAVYPESDPANGLPFCYYQADTSKPQSQWFVIFLYPWLYHFMYVKPLYHVMCFDTMMSCDRISGFGRNATFRYVRAPATGFFPVPFFI